MGTTLMALLFKEHLQVNATCGVPKAAKRTSIQCEELKRITYI